MQVLSQVQQVLLKYHTLLLTTFLSYALVLESEGLACSCMLPHTAWTAFLEGCRYLVTSKKLEVC